MNRYELGHNNGNSNDNNYKKNLSTCLLFQIIFNKYKSDFRFTNHMHLISENTFFKLTHNFKTEYNLTCCCCLNALHLIKYGCHCNCQMKLKNTFYKYSFL